MPRAPLPPELDAFLRAPRPAVVGTVTPYGSPVTTPCWYRWDDGRITLSMEAGGPRERNLRHDGRVALTVLGDDWYEHLSLLGQAVEFHDDAESIDIDTLSRHYRGEPYEDRSYHGTTVVADIERWHVFGTPGGYRG